MIGGVGMDGMYLVAKNRMSETIHAGSEVCYPGGTIELMPTPESKYIVSLEGTAQSDILPDQYGLIRVSRMELSE